jgi:hypothetical protein
MVATDGSGSSVFAGCYRCGGNHQVHECEQKVCTKCNAKIYSDAGKKLRHEARYCTGGGTPGGNSGKNRFSKGGDKGGGDTSKPKGSWGGKTKEPGVKGTKSSGGASESLPDPTNMKTKHLKAFMAKADAVLLTRDGGGSKKRKITRDEWEAMEPVT